MIDNKGLHMCGTRRLRKLETERKKTLSTIRQQRSVFELMVQRAQINGIPAESSLADVPKQLSEFERKAGEATTVEELEDLMDDAESQGQLRAYICPPAEVPDEGTLAIDLMGEWGVPADSIVRLREVLGPKLRDEDAGIARSALRALFEEYDSWSTYIDDHEDSMKRFSYVLAIATFVFSLLADLALHFPSTAIVGLLFGGTVGGCVSVIGKMPMMAVRPSAALSAYPRRILARVSTGAVAGLIGCALLAWGVLPISIQNQTFADLLNSCGASPSTSCTETRILVLLGVAVLFGFSERALASFEQVLGTSRRPGKPRTGADAIRDTK